MPGQLTGRRRPETPATIQGLNNQRGLLSNTE